MPELTRANRNYISLFINGRYIKNFLLNRAILDGYGKQAHGGRFPLAVIHIHIDLLSSGCQCASDQARGANFQGKELMTLVSEAIANSLKEQNLDT